MTSQKTLRHISIVDALTETCSKILYSKDPVSVATSAKLLLTTYKYYLTSNTPEVYYSCVIESIVKIIKMCFVDNFDGRYDDIKSKLIHLITSYVEKRKKKNSAIFEYGVLDECILTYILRNGSVDDLSIYENKTGISIV